MKCAETWEHDPFPVSSEETPAGGINQMERCLEARPE